MDAPASPHAATDTPPAEPRVCVVISAYNAERYVDEAIQSIRDQTYTGFEVVVVDDGSTDATPERLARHATDDPRIRVIRQDNTGVSGARNLGLAHTRAPLIACMDADDVAHPRRLARTVGYLDSHPHIGLVAAGHHVWHPDGRREPPHPDTLAIWAQGPAAIADCLASGRNCIAHSTVLFRRSAFDAAGGRYDPALKVAHDFDLWLRMSEVTLLACLPEVLVDYRVHPDSVCAQAGNTSILDVERAVRGHWRRVGMPPVTERIAAYQGLANIARAIGSPETVRELGRRMRLPALLSRNARHVAHQLRQEGLA